MRLLLKLCRAESGFVMTSGHSAVPPVLLLVTFTEREKERDRDGDGDRQRQAEMVQKRQRETGRELETERVIVTV